MEFAGRVAIVTGGSRGIGRAVALELARQGAAVVVNYKSGRADAEHVVAAIESRSGTGVAVQADVADPEQVRGMFDQVLADFSRLDILINNAGVEERSMLLDIPLEAWRRVLDVNLTGSLTCARFAARAMIEQGTGGKIVNITSIHQHTPRLGFGHYAVSKAGLWMLTKALAQELAVHRINVNAVAPGAIETDMNRVVLADAAKREAVRSRIPWGRIGVPEDVVGAVLFLASEASDYITGATIYADGGLSI